ncbi:MULTISPECIES: PLP-dependent cysteine synthase family protein [Sphingobacterium]|uniref:PLP-dependent cysteine synthase family protein n=1 Tax=Sphingobacterium TaxID=28453 RepID=UPI0025794BAE|nr:MULTISPECIES: cysteine synthase family protein [Sphingobacterium]
MIEVNLFKDFNVGNTPLVRNAYLSGIFSCNVFFKTEYTNPAGSTKDRVALLMILDAIKKGKINAGGRFVEASSGNTGYSIAYFAKNLGYSSTIFLSKGCSSEKIALLNSVGAEIVLCENSNGLKDKSSTQSRALAYCQNNRNTYFTNQYDNPLNSFAHFITSGPEIWEQTKGQVTHVIIGIGSGGSISGIGKFLKMKNKHIKILGVEPHGSIYSSKEIRVTKSPGKQFDPIEGIGKNFLPNSYNPKVVDKVYQVSEKETKFVAKEYSKLFCRLLGFSSAAVITAILQNKDDMNFSIDDNVVLLFPDDGDRYIGKIY